MKKIIALLLILCLHSGVFTGRKTADDFSDEDREQPTTEAVTDSSSEESSEQSTTEAVTDSFSEESSEQSTTEEIYDHEPELKPVIYLYPEEPTDVSVKLQLDGEFTCTYPAYADGWEVTAQPDGTLCNHADGKTYSYLYWEGMTNAEWDMSEGYVVRGEDTAAFLQETLSQMGLTPREYNEFIVYWLPQMQDNAYNLITFQQEVYTDSAKLEITPEPDSVLRVFMVFEALEEPVEIPAPEIVPFERNGFTVVEWGGSEMMG